MQHTSIKSVRRTVCLLILSLSMLFSAVIPAAAAEANGSRLLKAGKVSVEEAVILNLLDYGRRIVRDGVTGDVEDLIGDAFALPDITDIIPGGDIVSAVKAVFETSAYAYHDLGLALEEWRGQKKSSLQSIKNRYTDAVEQMWDGIESVYELGKRYRNSNTALHQMNDYNGQDLDQIYFGALFRAAKSVEKAKSEAVFKLSAKCRRQIGAWADSLYEMHNALPPMQAFYNLGRFGTFSVPDDAAFVQTNTPCMFISKSNGKVLNVYTYASAKKLKDGVNVNVYKYVEADADTQTFRIIDNGNGTYRIRVSEGTKYLDVYNTKTNTIAKNGAKVHIWSKNTAHWRDQSFKFESENGYIRILLAANPDYCLYVKSNGYLALGKTKAGNSAQLWKISYTGK